MKSQNKQHLVLVNKGLTSETNAVITKLMLINNHDYRDKKEVENKNKHLHAITKLSDLDDLTNAELEVIARGVQSRDER